MHFHRYNRCEMDEKTQTYTNHVRYDPWFHFFLLPVAGLMVIGALWAIVTDPGWRSARYLVFSVWLLVLAFKTRTYSLRQQDRIIRLEERLRLQTVLPENLRSRTPELSDAQLIALKVDWNWTDRFNADRRRSRGRFGSVFRVRFG